MYKKRELPTDSLREIRQLRLEKYKLGLNLASDIYKGFISVFFTALIFIMVFYLNEFRELYLYSEVALSDALLILTLLFFFISSFYFIVYVTLMKSIDALISGIEGYIKPKSNLFGKLKKEVRKWSTANTA